MKKSLFLCFVIISILTIIPVNSFAADKNADKSIYQIEKGSEFIEQYLSFKRNFPTDGWIILSCDRPYAKWYVDAPDNSWTSYDWSGRLRERTSFFSNKKIEAGEFCMCLADSAATSNSVTLSYEFYPICPIRYWNGTKFEMLEEYRMTDASVIKTLPEAPEKKGYHFDGWYREQDLITPITKIDTSIGKDWYIFPKYSPIEYTVNYRLNKNETNSAENPFSYTMEDDNIFLEEAYKRGYLFKRWYTYGENGLKTTVTEINTSLCSNITLYAEFQIINYQISYEIGGTINPNPTSYTLADSRIPLETPFRRGYEFDGWYKDSEFLEPITEIDCEQEKDIVIYGKWIPLTYHIQYELNGGMNAKENLTEYTVESVFDLKDPGREQYDFIGWYKDEKFQEPISSINEDTCSDLTLYAKWALHRCVIKYENGYQHSNPSYYTYGSENIVLEDASRPGCIFAGWYKDSKFQVQINEISIDEMEEMHDITVYAKWDEIVYTVSYELDGGENPSQNRLQYTVSTTFDLAPAVKEHYDFLGWYTDENFSHEIKNITESTCQNLVLYARWNLHPYQITYEDGGEHTNQTFFTINSEDITLEQPEKEGFLFDGWYTDAVFQNRIAKISISEMETCQDFTVYAKWVTPKYHIIQDSMVMRSNIDYFYTAVFPEEGYLEFECQPLDTLREKPFFWLADVDDTAGHGVRDIKIFNRTVSKGERHSIFCMLNPSWAEARISYTYYPKCRIYYTDNNKWNLLAQYYLSKPDSNYRLPDNYNKIKGYTVTNWYLDSAKTTEISEIDCSEGRDWYLYPEKKANKYIIQYELDNGINAETNPVTYTIEDETIKLAPAVRKGYRFNRWYTISGSNRNTVTEINTNRCENIKLYAEWSVDKYAGNKGKIVPKETSIKGKIIAKSKEFLVKWKKQKSVSGYQIQYSTNKEFAKKATKIKTVRSASTTKLTVKKLKAGKKYYVKIRTYRTKNGTVYYSKWSKQKVVRIKK